MDRGLERLPEYAGLVDEEGNLDRPLRVDPWFAPGLLLEDGRLRVDGHRWPGREIKPGAPMLEDFANLGTTGSDFGQAALKYASRWGLLDLCQHQLPIGHEIEVPLSFAVAGPARFTMGTTDPCRTIQAGEPVSAWAYWSRQAAAILAVSSRLRDGEWARSEDWSTLGEDGPWAGESPEEPGDLTRFRQPFVQSLVRGYAADTSGDAARAQRQYVERSVARGAIETWLSLGGAALELRWPARGGPGVGFRVNGLFGSLGIQLLQAAVDSPGFAICGGCPTILARRRGPGRPQRYCATCRAGHKPQQLADATRADRKRAGATA